MSGVVVVEKNAGSLAGAALRGGDLVVQRRRRRPHRHRPEGRHDHRRRRRRLDDRLHDAARPPGDLRQRRQRASATRCTTAPSTSAARSRSLGVDCVEAELTDADTEFLDRKLGIYGIGPTGRVPQVRLRQEALELRQPRARPSASWSSEWPTSTTESDREDATSRARRVARAQQHLHARGDQRHPHEVRARPLPDARLLDVQADPALGRADVPARAR